MSSQVVKELEEIGNWKVRTCITAKSALLVPLFCWNLCAHCLTRNQMAVGTSGMHAGCAESAPECTLFVCLQARSAAVDKLYSALQRVQDKDVLLPTLSKLLRFLSILGEDANFKISLSTMQILADLALKLGADIRPYLG